jgi:pimeloyl-ACP methyl ester carboxylesterase
MGYTSDEKKLSLHFRNGMSDGMIPGTGISLVSVMFHSHNGYIIPERKDIPSVFRSLFRSREMTLSNNNFMYYILLPDGLFAGRGAIILLHGLNERSWNKYMPWAVRLASDTRRPVVLFPIAYHMNRSPHSWVDRHVMMPLLSARAAAEPRARLSTFINVALSTRLSASPQCFMQSGYQTVSDLAELTDMISSGHHPYIRSKGPVDIFGYSIGAMVAQVLMLSQPGMLSEESRVMLFCGGSVLEQMNGISKHIMDSRAFDSLMSFYIRQIKRTDEIRNDSFMYILKETAAGRTFYAMTSLSRMKKIMGTPFRHMEGRLKAVTLSCDRVIPPSAVTQTMKGSEVEILSPDYPCIHENPFPVFADERSSAVDRMFDQLFSSAATFLS